MSDSTDNRDPERDDPSSADSHDPANEQAAMADSSTGLRAVVLELREQLVAALTDYPELPHVSSDAETVEAFQAELRARPQRTETLTRKLDEALAELALQGWWRRRCRDSCTDRRRPCACPLGAASDARRRGRHHGRGGGGGGMSRFSWRRTKTARRAFSGPAGHAPLNLATVSCSILRRFPFWR